MGIRFRCKNCNQKYELENDWAGKVSECLRCGAAMPVPGEPPENTPPKSNSIQRAIPVEGLNPMDKIQKLQIVSATAKNGAADDIIFRCKICQQKYRLPISIAGQVAECAKCKKNMVVPSVSDSPTVKAAKVEDNVVFWCKSCGLKYRLSKELSGQRAECTRCKSTFPIPKVSAKAPPARRNSNEPMESSVKLVQKVEVPPVQKETVPALSLASTGTLPEKTPVASVAIPASAESLNVKSVSSADKAHNISQDAEKTHTTIEMTKTVTMMVKYVIKLPGSNILFAWISIMLDWLAQFWIFRWIPKRAIGYIAVLIALAGVLYLTKPFSYESKGPAKCQIHTLCPKCGQREVMDILEINDAECSKCKAKVGYAWKCEACNKYFSKADTERIIINDAKLTRQEKIKLLKPPLCPHCRSPKVNYVAVKDATFG